MIEWNWLDITALIVLVCFVAVCTKLVIDGIFYNRFLRIMSEHDPFYNEEPVENTDDKE